MTPEQEAALKAAQQRRAIKAAQARREAENEPSFGRAIVNNVIGIGEVDSPGERAGQAVGDVANSFFSGVSRGAAELVGLPGTLDDLAFGGMSRLMNKMGVLSNKQLARTMSRRNALSGSSIRGLLSNATNGATEFEGQTKAGRIAGTIGEFTPGAPRGLLGFLGLAAAPGAASQIAGEATEGTAIEPFARAGAAIVTGMAGNGLLQGRLRPIGSDRANRDLAENLRAAGVKPTAGQITGGGILRNLEGTLEPTSRQREGFTVAAMRTMGSADTRATQEALKTAQTRIVGDMDDALRGVSIQPTTAMAEAADNIVRNYTNMAPSASLVPRARGIADEIIDAATSRNARDIDLARLREWRSALGRLTSSNDEATREAAISLRRLIDDATDRALREAGRGQDLAKLSTARNQYRNFLAISDAATRAGAEAGLLSPTQLQSAVIRTQGRQNIATGGGTDLEQLSRAGAAMFRPAPAVEAGAVRRVAPEIGLSGFGGLLGYQIGNAPGAVAGALAGAAAVPTLQAGMRSSAVQGLLNDPAFVAAALAARLSPGLAASGSGQTPQ